MKKVEKKINKSKCYCCTGTGLIEKAKGLSKPCKACNGTGFYKESYYYFIDPKNKIAFSKDTL